MNVTRRRMLAGLTGLAGGSLVIGAGALALRPGTERVPRRPLKVLSVATFSTMAAVADRACPAVGGLPSAWDLEVPESVDTLLDAMEPGGAAEVVQALQVLENPLVSLLTGGPPTPFSSLVPEAQDAVLAAWRDGGLTLRRTVWSAVTKLSKGAYWGHPATFGHSGYTLPPWATR